MMKRIIAVIISIIITLTAFGTTTFAQNFDDPRILINGETVECSSSPVIINGRTLVPVRGIFEKLGANVEWDGQSSTVKISGNNTNITMRIGYLTVNVNDAIKKTDVSPRIISGSTMVPLRFIAETLRSDVSWNPDDRTVNIIYNDKNLLASRGDFDNRFVVVIDAGHGGNETGAYYGNVKEKDLNLGIAKKLNELLMADGIKTYMTRKSDTDVGLYERSGLANKVNADLLVSIHNNAEDSNVSGSMTLYYPGTSNARGNLTAKKFASNIQSGLIGDMQSRDLGVIARPHLAVLRTSNMPAVIVEVGYMTNNSELQKLLTDSYQQKAAESLKKAIISSLNEI